MNRPAFALVLSIAVLHAAVKAQAENSPSFKKEESLNAGSFKDSVNDVKNNFSNLIRKLIDSGEDGNFPDGFAQAIGLSQAMPRAQAHIDISHHGDKEESRECNVTYSSDVNAGKHAICVLLSRTRYTKGEMSSVYYRVNLEGNLEYAVALGAKRGANGNAIPEGRSRIEEDINSPETRMAFKAEKDYWVKDWLKKQRTAKADAAKLTVPVVKEHAEAAHQAVNQEANTPASAAQ